MEPLTFKIITDADDSGVRRYERSLGGVDTTSRKTSAAIKGFVGDLQNAQNASDVTSSALNALTKILGTSLAATGVVVVGKLLVDAFNKVNEAVKESSKSVENANKEISKIALAGPSFETASKSAEVLNKTADELRKNLEKINESKFQSFIAGLTGAKDKMEELVDTTTKQAKEAQRQAIVQKLIELERNQTLDETTKKIAEQQKPYQELSVLARELNDTELQRAIISASQASARATQAEEQAKLDKKLEEERQKAAEKRIKEIEKLEEEAAAHRAKIFDAEEKARGEAYSIEAKFLDDVRKKETDRADEIEKQLEKIQKRKEEIKEEIELLIERNAKEAAGYGGTGRGAGQRPTSFETGLEQKLLRERYEAIRKRDEEYFNFVKDNLKSQGKAYDNWAVQKEIARRATADQTKEVLKNSQEVKDLSKEFNKLESESEGLKKESLKLKKSLLESRNKLDDFGKSLFDFAGDFKIASKNMIDKALGTSAKIAMLGDTANMTSSVFQNTGSSAEGLGGDLSTARTNLVDFGEKLKTILPEPSKGGALATEETLGKVLKELKDTLTQLKTYAHAT